MLLLDMMIVFILNGIDMSRDKIATEHFVEDAKKVIAVAKKCRGIKGITFHMNKNVDTFVAGIDLYNEKHDTSSILTNNETDTITIKW